MSTNAEIVKHHVESLVNGDVDEVMSDFAANAVILCGPQPIRGSDAISACFSGAAASFDGLERDVSVSESDQRNPDPVRSQLRYDSRGANDRTPKLHDFWDQLVNEQDNETSSRSV